MKKIYIFVFKLKNYILPIILLLFTLSLLLFSTTNLVAAKNGLKLWANSVIPSIFPFFVATELLSKTNIPYLLGNLFNNLMKPLFNISGEGSFALIMGWISGYPVGAKIACSFRKQNILPKEECERLLSFTNNSGPLFIVGTVGVSLFGNIHIGVLLLLSHILGCITVGIIFRFWKYSTQNKYTLNSNEKTYSNISLSNIGGILGESIYNSISTILMIGGFIVMFSVIISILNRCNILNIISYTLKPICNMFCIDKKLIIPFLTGIIEVTNGISLISAVNIKAISINIILTSFLLGIGGISILLQVLSITSKTDLSIKPYIYGKILHGCFSAIYTFILIYTFPFFNFNL